jgi:hypothetical protein
MRTWLRLATVASSALLVLAGAPTVHAFNESTHRAINAQAGQGSQLDATLRNSLGFLFGADTPIRDRNGTTNVNGLVNSALDWVVLGGVKEDDPYCRAARHFHDPLQPWDTAGLRTLNPFIVGACSAQTYASSVRWGQDANQSIGGRWSWFDARRFFAAGLTSADPAERDQSFADGFRALGHAMHLVADASVPEHVRNDTHITESILRTLGLRGIGNYEYWVEENVVPAGSFAFDPAILRQPTGDAGAPVPVARLIDTRTYAGTPDSNVTLTPAIGIAEFANANFFSEGTGIGQYPFPDHARLVSSQHAAPATGRVRAYWAKGAGDGIPVDPALAECALDEAEGTPAVYYTCVDENVWAATAQVMVPRAIGYARGALDYFFRGRVEIAPPARYAYGLARWVPGNAGSFTTLELKVRNATDGEETGAGQLVAVVRYRTSTGGDVIQNPSAPLSAPVFTVSAPQAVTLGRAFQELTFDFSASPIPTNSADLFLTVVYRGPLGPEADALAVGGKDLMEPDPFDRANITDYDCFAGTPYQVASSTGIMPPYHFPDHTDRDVDGDQVQDLFGPWTERGVFLKTFDLAGPIASAGPGNFDESTDVLDFAQFSRYVLLQDRDFYGMAVLRQQLSEFSTGASFGNLTEAGVIDGIVNHLFQLGPFLVHEYNLSFTYRGLTTYRIFLLLASPEMNFCLQGSETFTPDLAQTPDTVAR